MQKKTQTMLPDIQRTIVIDAQIQKVWNAISSSEGLASWLMPNDFKLEMGYEFTFQSKPQNGWDGIVHCKVTEINAPKRLAFTWCGNNLEQYVSFELIELEKNKTQLTLVHSGWSEENKMLRDIMYDGWGYLTEGLNKKIGEKSGGYLS
jgi:uncharacterized protein YndB with AHSA1/START domain